jgi:septum formation inhibitor-activating ATPase MinD
MPAKSKIYGIICTKGGVGKTTITANLGAILADNQHKLDYLIEGFHALRDYCKHPIVSGSLN